MASYQDPRNDRASQGGWTPGEPPLPSAPEPAAPAGFREARSLFIGGGLAGTVLISLITLYQWLDPWVPLALALGMGVVLSAAITLVFCNQERPRAFAIGSVLWALLALPTAAWGLAPVRAMAVELLGYRLTEPAQVAALNDVAAQVQQRACVALGVDNQGFAAYVIADGLLRAPLQGAQCLQQVAAKDPAGAARLSGEFMMRWQQVLSTDDPEPICAIAPHGFALNPMHPTKPTMSLTECAVSSADAQAAQCCADALAGYFDAPADYVDGLDRPDTLTLARRQQLFINMVPHAFSQIDASRKRLGGFETQLLRTQPARNWILAVGCDTLMQMHDAQLIVDALEAVARSQGCDMTLGTQRVADSWRQICVDWAAPEARTPDLCAPIASDALEQALSAASALVHSAIDRRQAGAVTDEILMGIAELERFDGTHMKEIDRMKRLFDPSRLPPGTDPRLIAALHEANMNSGEYEAFFRHYLGDRKISEENAMAQDLLKDFVEGSGVRPWSELKQYATPEQRALMDSQMETLTTMLKETGQELPSSLGDVLK